MRRFGELADPARRYRTRPGAYGVVLDGRDVLMTVQAGSDREIQLPGGALDPGEGALRALHRECLEETGWRIRVERRIGAFQRFAYLPEYGLWARKVCQIYLARPVYRVGPPAEPGHEAVWMPVERAAALAAVEGDRHYLAAVARRLR